MAEQIFDTRRITRDQQGRVAAATTIGLSAMKPMLQFQISLLRLCAHNLEMFARNYEKGLETFSSDAEQQGEVDQQERQRAA